MGAPYSQLQTLRYNLSGREIGVDKYKPFTVANERIASSVEIDGLLQGAVRESGVLKASLSTGEQSAAPSDRSAIGVLVTGSLSSVGGDSARYGVSPNGLLDSTVHGSTNLSNTLSSGDFSEPFSDVFSQTITIAPAFSGEFRESCSCSLRYAQGSFSSFPRDVAELDFLFFTGSYSIGRLAQLISGSDAVEFDLLFFTGSYQG